LTASIDAATLIAAQSLAKEVITAPHVMDWAIRLVLSTQPDSTYFSQKAKRFIRCGASPRAAQSMIAMGKVRALLAGRYALSIDDLRAVALPALRHRLALTFEADADQVDSNEIVRRLVKAMPLEAP
jgi:MoxR-like ATPase